MEPFVLNKYDDFLLDREVSPKKIENEGEAIAILLDLNVEHLEKFLKLYTELSIHPLYNKLHKKQSEEQDSRIFKIDKAPYYPNSNSFRNILVHYANNISKEDKDFLRRYFSFIKKYLNMNLGDFVDFINEIEAHKLWQKDIKKFAQALYDEGLIFTDEIYFKLGIENIDFTHGGKIYKFYQYWCKRSGWTLEQAFSLFTGQTPNESLIGEKDNSLISKFNIKMIESLKNYSQEEDGLIFYDENGFRTNLTLELGLFISVEDIKSYNHQHEGKIKVIFKPKEIVRWLLKFTHFIPPYPLIHYLFEKDDAERENYQAQREERLKKLEQTKDNMPKMPKETWKTIRLQKPTSLYADIIDRLQESKIELNFDSFCKRLEESCSSNEWKELHDIKEFNSREKSIIWKNNKVHKP